MEKKEIWKLLELLNEYEKEITQVNYTPECWTATTRGNLSYLSYSTLYSDLLLISKNYWFIQRLVEQDKIDTDAYKTVYSGDLDKRKTLTMSSGWDEFYQVTEHWVYESLLMLLSISDTPIEDLISYLK